MYYTIKQVTYRICANARSHASIHRSGGTLRNGLARNEVAHNLVEQTGTKIRDMGRGK